MNESIPQSIDVLLEQLADENPKLRYEALHQLALIPLGERFREVDTAMWKLTEDTHPRVSWAAGIALSMILARHNPYSLFNMQQNIPYEISSLATDVPKDSLGIPDFLGEWE